jgi:hypothetical protein
MREWLGGWWDWVLARDPTLNADQRLSRWSNLATVASVVVAIVGWAVGWIFNIPWQLGLYSGLIAWVVFSNRALTRGRAAVRTEESASAEELERLATRLGEVEQERNELRAENQQLKSQADEELKQESRRLSDELFRFAKERDKDDPQHDPNYPIWVAETEEQRRLESAKARHDEETWSQYRQRYEGAVRALLVALERCEWCDAEERKEIEGELNTFWRSPSQRMEQVAARLSAFGKRL